MKRVTFIVEIDGEFEDGSVLIDANEHMVEAVFSAMFPQCRYSYHEEVEL